MPISRLIALSSLFCLLLTSLAEAGRTRRDLPTPSTPVLTAPSSAPNGSFSLYWSSADSTGVIYTIKESVNDGPFATIVTSRYQGSEPRSYSGANKVMFKAQACNTGGKCSAWTNPRTVFTGSVGEPDSYDQQLLYEYNIRTGDFDGNGHNDILIERLTPGDPDGSFQTTILEGMAGGPVIKVPTSAEVNVARSFPSNTDITAGTSDNNFDGFADIVLSGLGSLGSSSYIEDSLILYASGKPYQSQPRGLTFLDDDYARFFNDIAKAIGNPNHYAENTQISIRPVYAPRMFCREDTYQPILLHNLQYCESTVQLVDFEVAYFNIAYHPLAPDVTNAYQRLVNSDFSSGDPLKLLSDALEPVIGVASFGYQEDGTLAETAYPDDSDIDDKYDDPVARFMIWVLTKIHGDPQGGDPLEYERHQYDFVTPICSPNTRTPVVFFPQNTVNGTSETAYIEPENCTLANVYCWQRKNPAPRANGATETVNDGQQSLLDGSNPVVTWVHPNERVTVNETLGANNDFGASPHVLHDPLQSEGCAQDKPDWRDINGPETSSPSRCAYLHRQTRRNASTQWIEIATHGEGYNRPGWVDFNEVGGIEIFKRTDRWVQRQMAGIGACTND